MSASTSDSAFEAAAVAFEEEAERAAAKARRMQAACQLFEDETASLTEVTEKPENIPVPDDTDSIINDIVGEFYAAQIPIEEIP